VEGRGGENHSYQPSRRRSYDVHVSSSLSLGISLLD
jgi:hypothetical protein